MLKTKTTDRSISPQLDCFQVARASQLPLQKLPQSRCHPCIVLSQSALPLGPHAVAAIMAHQGCKVFPLVKEVRAYVKEGDGDQGADCHDVADEHWINGTDPSTNNTPIANPMSGYAQYAGARKSWGINALGGLVVEIEADDGTTGVGVTIGGEAGCCVVDCVEIKI